MPCWTPTPDGVAAALSFERARAPFTVGCHPADAIALALRADAPIYATAAALALACRAEGPCQHREPRDRVREWLDGVAPVDFGIPPPEG